VKIKGKHMDYILAYISYLHLLLLKFILVRVIFLNSQMLLLFILLLFIFTF